MNLKANTNYAISLSTNQDAFAWFRNANGSTISTATFTETINYRIVSLSEDVSFIDIGWEHLVVGQSYNLTMSEIMINEGTEALPYQEYNGEIIHEKDIEPVTLFSGRSNSNITLTDNWYNYDRFKIEFEDNFSNQNSIEIDNSGTLVAMGIQAIDTYDPNNWAYVFNMAIGEFYANTFKFNNAGRFYIYQTNELRTDKNSDIFVTKILAYRGA